MRCSIPNVDWQKASLAGSSLGAITSQINFQTQSKDAYLFLSGSLCLPSQKNTSAGTDGPVSAALCDIDVNSEERRCGSWL